MTNATGGFNITGLYSCPSSAAEVYIVASGGNPGLSDGTNNSAAVLLSALGPCGGLSSSTFISINEVSTVASVYALAPFMASVTAVGSDANNANAMATAFAQVNAMVNTSNGLAPGPALPNGYSAPITALYTLADVLASCVNTGGGTVGDNSACGKLFDLATPPVGNAPANTADAILNISKRPDRNVAAILYLVGTIVPFQPVLSSPPLDWTLPVLPNITLSASPGVVNNGSTASGVITLGQAAPTGGLTVTLSSSNSGRVTANSQSMIAAGETTCPFTFSGVATGIATITASAPLYASGTLGVVSYPGSADPVHGGLKVTPTLYPTYTPTAITLSVWLPDSDIDGSSVQASEVDSQGGMLAALGLLHDDGDRGDQITADRVFTLITPVTDTTVSNHYYKISFHSISQGLSFSTQTVSVASVSAMPVSDDASYVLNIQDNMRRIKDAASAYSSLESGSGLNQAALDSLTQTMASVMGNIQQLSAYDNATGMTTHAHVTGRMVIGRPLDSFTNNFLWATLPFHAGDLIQNQRELTSEKKIFLSDSFYPKDPGILGVMSFVLRNPIETQNCVLSDLSCRENIWMDYSTTHDAGALDAARNTALSFGVSEGTDFAYGVADGTGALAEDATGVLFPQSQELSPVSTFFLNKAQDTAKGYVVDNVLSSQGRQILIFGSIGKGQTTILPGGVHDMILSDGTSRGEQTGIYAPGNSVVPVKSGNASGAYSAPPIWPMQGQNAQKTSNSPYLGPPLLPSAPKWQISTGAAVVGDLAVSQEGVLYFASDALYAVNSGGGTFASKVPIASLATGPAVDDINGVVYVAANNADGSFTVYRFRKDLSGVSSLVVPNSYYGHISPLIVGSDGTLYFTAGRFPATVYAVGANGWSIPLCANEGSPIPAAIDNAPAIGRDGSVYVMCEGPLGGSGQPMSGLYKLNSASGATLATYFYNKGATEPILDKNQHIRAGFFDQYGSCGAFDEWDGDLNLVTSHASPWTPCGMFTMGRASLLSDGTSTVRLTYAYGADAAYGATGQYIWSFDSGSTPPSFTTPVTVDALGRLYLGTSTGFQQRSQTDGSLVWNYVLNENVTTQPVISNAHNLYVGTTSGNIYAFGP